jgi:hypothetical protein
VFSSTSSGLLQQIRGLSRRTQAAQRPSDETNEGRLDLHIQQLAFLLAFSYWHVEMVNTVLLPDWFMSHTFKAKAQMLHAFPTQSSN